MSDTAEEYFKKRIEIAPSKLASKTSCIQACSTVNQYLSGEASLHGRAYVGAVAVPMAVELKTGLNRNMM